MTKTSSIRSYPHCRKIWDDAYAAPSGSILVGYDGMTPGAQSTLLGELLHYRVLVRRDNSKFYPEGHPEHMTSIFDPFQVTKVNKDGKLYIRLRKRRVEQFQILPEDLE